MLSVSIALSPPLAAMSPIPDVPADERCSGRAGNACGHFFWCGANTVHRANTVPNANCLCLQ